MLKTIILGHFIGSSNWSMHIISHIYMYIYILYMYVCVYIYIYIYTHTHNTHPHTHTHTHTHTLHTYIRAHASTYIYVGTSRAASRGDSGAKGAKPTIPSTFFTSLTLFMPLWVRTCMYLFNVCMYQVSHVSTDIYVGNIESSKPWMKPLVREGRQKGEGIHKSEEHPQEWRHTYTYVYRARTHTYVYRKHREQQAAKLRLQREIARRVQRVKEKELIFRTSQPSTMMLVLQVFMRVFLLVCICVCVCVCSRGAGGGRAGVAGIHACIPACVYVCVCVCVCVAEEQAGVAGIYFLIYLCMCMFVFVCWFFLSDAREQEEEFYLLFWRCGFFMCMCVCMYDIVYIFVMQSSYVFMCVCIYELDLVQKVDLWHVRLHTHAHTCICIRAWNHACTVYCGNSSIGWVVRTQSYMS